MRDNVRCSFLLFHSAFRFSAKGVVIPFLANFHARFIRYYARELFFFRVRANVLCTSGERTRASFGRFFHYNVMDGPRSCVVSTCFFYVDDVRFMFANHVVPLHLRARQARRFPVATFYQCFISARCGVSEGCHLEVVARDSRRFNAFGLAIICGAGNDAALVNRSLSRVRRSVTLSNEGDGTYRANA